MLSQMKLYNVGAYFSLFACALVCLLGVSPASAVITFEKWFGGTNLDLGTSVVQTTDSGYIATGYTSSYGAGSYDVYLIKTDANGDTVWTKTFGGSGYDWGMSIVQTTDLGYIATGYTDSYGAGYFDVYLIKTDANGDTLWTKIFGGTGYEYGTSVVPTTDLGYIISGSTDSYGAGYYDVYLIKTDSNGNTVWTRTFGGSNNDLGTSVAQTTDNGYIITGSTYSYGAGMNDVYLIKTDANGDTVWTRTFGGSGSDWSTSVARTNDGYIITGSTYSMGAGSTDVYLIKTDTNGDTVWTRTFGGSDNDRGYSVVQTADLGYVVTGYTASYGAGDDDVYLIKTDANGDTVWTRTFGGIHDDRGYSVALTNDGGYVIAGWTKSYGAGSYDVYLIKTDSLGNVGVEEEGVASVKNSCPAATIFSGPLHLPADTRCRIFDIAGRIVEPDKIRPGVYFVEVDGTISQKIVKVR